jgi:hypothetical protein
MALIYRSILEVRTAGFIDDAPELLRSWVGHKLRHPDIDLPPKGETRVFENGCELTAVSAAGEDGQRAFRGRLYEKRNEEEVKTTFTAIDDGTQSWVWVDLERWSEEAWDSVWVPYSPGIVTQALRAVECWRGTSSLDARYHLLEGVQGARLAKQVLDPDREVPIVVVTPSAAELADDLEPAAQRAWELQRRLAGISPVYLLGRGAVTEFSRAMLTVGEQMDVHSGAVRTYLPGAGGPSDASWRHRYVPPRQLLGRPADIAARIVARALQRAACHQAPPEAWRALRQLPEFASGGIQDTELEEIVDLADADRIAALNRAQEAEARAEEAELHLELERETQAELLGQQERLVRRVRFLEAALRERGEQVPFSDGEPLFEPDFCSEVVEHARKVYDRIEIGARVDEGAEQLDQHADPSWARKALQALDALQAYAEAKAAGADGSFMTFCERAESPSVVPKTWVSLVESETTNNNPKFRELRTFPVDPRVAPGGELYMPAHIKLEKGGYPAPRIHFHDDTSGSTEKIHVGWLGPHLESKSKN